MADHTKIGNEYAPIVWEVERGKIREMVRAIGDPDPIYTDREAAIRAGYRDTPAPPTFLTIPMMWCASMPLLIEDLKINYLMVLHGGEEYEYYREIYPGDTITGVPKVVNIEEKTGKTGNLMDMITVEVLYRNQEGVEVAKARSVLVERK